MKKVLLSLGVVATALTASAQITVTSANLPVPFDAFDDATDTAISVSIGSAGANQTWDFSSFKPASIDGTVWVDPANTDFAAKYPTATLAIEDGQGGVDYYRSGTDGLYMIGTEGGFLSGTYNPELTVIKMPVTFGDSYQDDATLTTGGSADPTGGPDSVRAKITTSRDVEVDAWGNVTLPNKTYPALRLNIVQTMDMVVQKKNAILGWQDDPVLTNTYRPFFGFPLTVNYFEWYTNDNSVINTLVSVQLDSIGQPAVASYNYVDPIGIEELASTSITVYPNPATDFVTVSLENTIAGYIKVYDATGKFVAKQTISGNNTTITTSNYTSGVYFIHVIENNGKVASVNRFNVVK